MSERYAHEIATKRLRVIVNDQNTGFAGGNNIGYRLVSPTSRYVVLLNNDVICRRRWLEELLRPLRELPVICLVGTLYDESVRSGAIRDLYLKKRCSTAMSVNCELVTIPTQRCYSGGRAMSMFFVSGNGVAIRKSAFSLPFDDEYFAYAEDTYLGWLAQIRGFTVVCAFDARMRHLGGGTKKVTNRSFNRLLDFHGSKNQMMNFLLFYEWKNVLRVFPLFALTQMAHVIHNPQKCVNKIRAVAWIVSHLPRILRKRRALQAQRRVSDSQIIRNMSGQFFDEENARIHYRKAYQRLIFAMNRFSLFYCKIVGLSVYELVEPSAREQKSGTKRRT